MLRIFLTNLGKYNEGELVGKWIDLPTENGFDEHLEEIGISDEPDENGIYYDEYFITDYETDIDGLEIGEYDNIEELNELAEELDGLDDHDLEVISALCSDGYDLEEALDKKDDCMIYYDCSDMEEVAEQYAEEVGLLDSIPENLRYYFDFEAFGRDMKIEGHFIFTDEGNCVQVL